MKLEVNINGKDLLFDVNPTVSLMNFLRQQGYYSVKNGCDEGTCGSCVVMVDGRPLKTCIMFVGQVQGAKILTSEGLGTLEVPHPLHDEFVEFGAIQCGYCIPGMIMSANALLLKNPDPTEVEIMHGLDGNICRCTGYIKQIDAVKKAAERLRGHQQ